jgi:iron complex outermembrane receptor protein
MRNVLNGRLVRLAVCAALVAPSAALAADEVGLEEVVVTAQKREQNLQDVPISIGVLTADAIADRNIVGLTQLIQLSPSINFKDGYSPVATSLSIRGVNSYTFDGGIQPSISVVVDGVPLARAGEFVQELADIDRIEILRGPQGTLFGQNATGGAINIVRKGPTDQFEGRFDVSATDDSDTMVRAVLSGPLSDRVRARVSLFNRDFRGYIRNFSNNGPTGGWLGGNDAYGGVAKMEIDVSDAVTLSLVGDYRKATHGMTPQIAQISEGFDFNFNGRDDRIEALGNGDFALGQTIIADPYKASVSRRGDKNRNEGWGVSADLTWRVGDGLTFKSITAYRSFDDRNNPDVDGSSSDGNRLISPIVSVTTSAAPTCCDHSRRQYNDYLSQEFRLEKVGEKADWTIGAYYNDLREAVKNSVALLILDAFVDGTGGGSRFGGTRTFFDEYFLQDQRIYNNKAMIEAYSVFADLTLHLSERTDLFGGLRYTSEDVSVDLNNKLSFAPLTRAQIATRFNSSTMVLDTTGLPEFPAISAASIGKASKSESFVSGRVGLNHELSEDVRVYGTVSRGYIGAGAKVSRSAVTNDAFLLPSKADAIEVGLKSLLLDRRLRLNAAIFTQKTTDLQASRLIPGTVNSEIVNAGNLEAKGVEVDLAFRAGEYVTFDAAVAYLDSEFSNLVQPCYPGQTAALGCTAGSQVIDGKVGLTSPELKYSVGMNLSVPMAGDNRFYGSLGYVWQDDVHFNLDHDPLTVQEAYGLLDLTVGVRFGERYDFALFGKNLTDEQYMLSKEAAVGALGRMFVRPARDGNRYFGAKIAINF